MGGCFGEFGTYSEYAKNRDAKRAVKKNVFFGRRRWEKKDRKHRAKILWEEAKRTGRIHGRLLVDYILERYKKGAEKRGIDFSLSRDEFLSFWQKPCFYCGDEIDTIGLDRKDSFSGYQINNVVPCCTNCNLSKRRLSDSQFIEMCKKIAKRHQLGSQRP